MSSQHLFGISLDQPRVPYLQLGLPASSSLLRRAQVNMATTEKKPFERLPTDVVPSNYKVELKPDLKAFTFEGKLEVTAEVRLLFHDPS